MAGVGRIEAIGSLMTPLVAIVMAARTRGAALAFSENAGQGCLNYSPYLEIAANLRILFNDFHRDICIVPNRQPSDRTRPIPMQSYQLSTLP